MTAALGAADVTHGLLSRMVADSLGAPDAQIVTRRVRTAPYTDVAIFTGGRFLVDGYAHVGSSTRPYAFFVKIVQSWRRSPLYATAPPGLRDMAIDETLWRAEIDFYRSDLHERLPGGLHAPRARAVIDLDGESAVLWLDLVAAQDVEWDLARHAWAARQLGRLAACPSMPSAPCGPRNPRLFADTWLEHVVLPELRGTHLWTHPLVARAFDGGLRRQLLDAAQDLPRYLDELDAMPLGAAHGDACPANLLVTGDGITLVDFGFFGPAPLGHDLGQLMLGEIQSGRRPVHTLPDLERSCLPAYVQGLRDEGCDVPAAQIRRTHALLMLVTAGLAAVPVEHLDATPTPALHRMVAARAAAARFALGLAATEPEHSAVAS